MAAAGTSPAAIVDPRPASHVVDLAGVLDGNARAAIESSVQEAAAAGELFVVIVDSTDGVVARQWTTTLFNRLQLDTRGRNRGVVLMAAIKDRKAEIVIGDGYEGSFTATTDNVMSSVVVPRFRNGAPQQAMVDGAAALATAMVASMPLPSADAGTAAVDERTAAFDKAVAAARASKQMKAVVDPRPEHAVLDLAKALAAADVIIINERGLTKIGEDIDLVVVTVKDIGKHAPRAFATAVFEKFGLDALPAGRGVLIFVLAGKNKKQRAVEMVHGAGFPAFTAPAFAAAATDLPAQAKTNGISAATTDAVNVVVGVERAITAMNAEEARLKQERAAAQARAVARVSTVDDHNDAGSDIPLWAGGIGLFGVAGVGLREGIRRRPRKCRTCAVNMHRLGEEADDAHLSDGERAEERVGSVDYDIWACGTCGEVLKTRWGAIFTAYSRCRGCSWKTMRTSSRTLQAATEYSTGLAEVTERCEHCSFHHVSTRTIPRKPKPSPPSSSGFSSGSSGGGGGSSSGRGSSGSW
jgi:uncharacterized protein